MRRTNNTSGLDQEPGVSSGGPTLPVLFGRGSLMARSGSSGQLSVASGITVRATAIAAAGAGQNLVGPVLQPAKPAATIDAPATQLAAVCDPRNHDLWVELDNWQDTASTSVNPWLAGSHHSWQAVLATCPCRRSASRLPPRRASRHRMRHGWRSTYPLMARSTANYTGPTQSALSQYVPVVDTNNSIIGFGYVQSWTSDAGRHGRNGRNFERHDVAFRVAADGLGNVCRRLRPRIDARHDDFTALFQDHASHSTIRFTLQSW